MRKKRFFSNSTFVAAAISLFLLTLLPPAVVAEPRLPHLFTDHMVLQEDMKISVWGWADPQERITVNLGPNTRETVATAEGRWDVSLPAMHAGRSEEHTSELQSRFDLVCRLLLEKKKKN